jgi:HSP20 family molecular chaperone IbpA
VEAGYRDGFLVITLPKRKRPGPQTTQIQVR